MNTGDKVIRMLGGSLPMELAVTSIIGGIVTCGAWTFDEATGAEIDDDLGWGPAAGFTGSFIVWEGHPRWEWAVREVANLPARHGTNKARFEAELELVRRTRENEQGAAEDAV